MTNKALTTIAFLLACLGLTAQDLRWVATGGSAHTELVKALAVDATGNAYVAGTFSAVANFNPQGSFTLAPGGLNDVFICKYNGDGSLGWARRVGGTGQEEVIAVKVDVTGDVYVAGFFNMTGDFDPGPGSFTLSTPSPTVYMPFILKLDAAGNFVWAKKIDVDAHSGDLALDGAGSFYFCSFFGTAGDFDPGPGTAYATHTGSNVSGYVLKFTTNGDFTWVRHFETVYQSRSLGLGLDEANNIQVWGDYISQVDFDPGPGTQIHTTPQPYNANGFMCRLDAAGNFMDVQTFEGTNGASPQSVCFDSNGNKYSAIEFFRNGFTGNATDTIGYADLDPGPGSHLVTPHSGYGDVYLCKFSASGSFLWAIQAGHPYLTYIAPHLALRGNELYLAGGFTGTDDFDPGPGSFLLTSDSSNSPSNYITKFDLDGNFRYALKLPGSLNRNPSGFALGPGSDLFIAGNFFNTCDFDPSPASHTISSLGETDFYIERLSFGTAGIEIQHFSGQELSVYPNPGEGRFTMLNAPGFDLSLADASGRIVWRAAADGQRNRELDLEGLAPGLYILHASSGNQRFSKKIIINHKP